LKFRVFGLADYVNINCTTVRELDYQNYHWAKFVHPFVLIGLYFISATLIRSLIWRKKNSVSKQLVIKILFQFKNLYKIE
jgi:hypothetical protein